MRFHRIYLAAFLFAVNGCGVDNQPEGVSESNVSTLPFPGQSITPTTDSPHRSIVIPQANSSKSIMESGLND